MNYYNKISFSRLRYIDPNDPLVPESAQKADADVGVLYHLPMFDIGFNVKNLLAFPYRGGNFMLENMRSFTGYLVFHTSEEAEVSLHPSIAVTALKDYFAGDFNIFMKIKQAAFIGATLSMWGS